MIDPFVSTLFYAGLAVVVGQPVIEYVVHRYIMHESTGANTIPMLRDQFDSWRKGHADHHIEYSPSNFFRNSSNEEATLHFRSSTVGKILMVPIVVGSVGSFIFDSDWIDFTGGLILGTLANYGIYETLHYLIHVPSKRRERIYREVAERLQDSQNSIPLTELFDRYDRHSREVPVDFYSKIQDFLFRQQWFRTLALHHFEHHQDITRNFNIGPFPLDGLFGTKYESTKPTIPLESLLD